MSKLCGIQNLSSRIAPAKTQRCAWQPPVCVADLTVHLPQSRDSSYTSADDNSVNSVLQESKRVSLQCDKPSHSLSVSRRKEADCRQYNPGARVQLKFGTADFQMCFTTPLCVVRVLKPVNLSTFFSVLLFFLPE
jgi:hypothetical protein